MKLSKIHQIEEGRKIIDSESIGGRKVAVLENPSPQSVINELDRIQDTLGGWISKHGTWIWNRYSASHGHIANSMGIDPSGSIAFYIKPEVEKINGEVTVTDVTFEVSEFSGSKSFKALMSTKFISGIMKLLADRNERLNTNQDDDFSDLLGSLTASDY